jgi:hypothetical protein
LLRAAYEGGQMVDAEGAGILRQRQHDLDGPNSGDNLPVANY